MKVENMVSNKGNKIANQFTIRDEAGITFQSYNSIIAHVDTSGNVTLDVSYWDYSTTTGKYRNLFLGETRKETQKKIESGEYKLVNLN